MTSATRRFRRRRRFTWSFVIASACSLAPAGEASADDVDRCVAASERGQAARRKKQLSEARTAFIECSSEKCPAIVRQACGEWFDQVEQAMPSIVIAVVGTDGRDVTGAKVTIDDQPLADGAAAHLDPGAHTVRVQAEGYENGSLPFVAREGDKNRTLRVSLQRTSAGPSTSNASKPDEKKSAAASSSSSSSADAKHDGDGGIPTLALITGGAAVLTLGSFVFFAISGRSQAQDLRATCAPTCPESERDVVQTRYLIADVSLIATVILGGISVWSLLSKSDAPPASSSSSLR